MKFVWLVRPDDRLTKEIDCQAIETKTLVSFLWVNRTIEYNDCIELNHDNKGYS